jgi:ABC-type transport system involved in multi-copper enzyme maturation permease subunit
MALDILDADKIDTEDEISEKGGRTIVTTVDDRIEEIAKDVERGYLPALIIIEEGFTAGELDAKIRFINDPGQSIQVQIIFQTLVGLSMNIRGRELILPRIEEWFEAEGHPLEYLEHVKRYFDESWGEMGSLFSGGDEQDAESDSDDGGTMGSFISEEQAEELGIVNEQVVGLDIDNPGYSQAVAGMAVMFAFFTLTHAAANLFEERDSGTLKRLLMSPLGISAVLVGKAMNIVAVAALQLVFLFIAGLFLFKLNIFRDPVHLLLFILATAFMASGVGLFLASIASSAQTAGGLSTLFILVMVSLGGAMFPAMMMPKWMQAIGKFTPVHYAMSGFQGIFWYQRTLIEQLGLLIIVLLWAVGFMALGILVFRKKLDVR